MSVYYRKADARWAVRYRTPDGWKSKICPPEVRTKSQAITWEAAWLAAGHGIPAIKKNEPNVETLVAMWLALKAKDKKLAPATAKQYRLHLTKWVLPRFRYHYLPTLSVSELRAWIRDIQSTIAARTVRNVIVSATVFIDDCMAEEWTSIATNPMRHPGVRREIPASRPVEVGVVYLSLEVVRVLLSDPQHPPLRRVIWAIAATTGMRMGEIVGLRWRDIGEDTLRVERAYRLVGRDAGRPKTDGSVRTMLRTQSRICPKKTRWSQLSRTARRSSVTLNCSTSLVSVAVGCTQTETIN